MYDVITVGSATLDVFVDTDSELVTIRSRNNTDELMAYPVGSKILIKNLEFMTGGGGTNTAVAFTHLGHKVGYLGKLGRDDGAKRILELLKKNKITFLGSRGDDMTSYSIILDSIAHDRTILAYKGVMDSFRFSEINTSRLKTKWFYFSALTGKSFKVLEKLADFAAKNNIKIAFNPSSYLAEKGADFLSKVLARTNILVLNKEEAELIVGKGEIKSMLKRLRSYGPEIAIITDGKKGAYCSDDKQNLFIKAHKIKVVEATGAGDAFAAGFLSGMIRKDDMKFALRLGLANAESVITHKGAKSKLLSYRSALMRVKKDCAKIRLF